MKIDEILLVVLSLTFCYSLEDHVYEYYDYDEDILPKLTYEKFDLDLEKHESSPLSVKIEETLTSLSSVNKDTTTSTVIAYTTLKALQRSTDCRFLSEGSLLVDQYHCRRFYVCQNTKPILLQCSKGQWFDLNSRQCQNHYKVTNCPVNRD